MCSLSDSLGTDEYKCGDTPFLRPSEIRFCQLNLGKYFCGRKYSLKETLQDLLDEEIKPHELPLIHVIYKDGLMFVVEGNRRLYLFRLMEDGGLLPRVHVSIKPNDLSIYKHKFTTQTQGKTIMMRDPSQIPELRQLIINKRKKIGLTNNVVWSQPLTDAEYESDFESSSVTSINNQSTEVKGSDSTNEQSIAVNEPILSNDISTTDPIAGLKEPDKINNKSTNDQGMAVKEPDTSSDLTINYPDIEVNEPDIISSTSTNDPCTRVKESTATDVLSTNYPSIEVKEPGIINSTSTSDQCKAVKELDTSSDLTTTYSITEVKEPDIINNTSTNDPCTGVKESTATVDLSTNDPSTEVKEPEITNETTNVSHTSNHDIAV